MLCNFIVDPQKRKARYAQQQRLAAFHSKLFSGCFFFEDASVKRDKDRSPQDF